jgi:transposase
VFKFNHKGALNQNEEYQRLQQQVKELLKENKRLKEEREILADATAFFAESRRKSGNGKD